MPEPGLPPVSPFRAGLTCRCPACGRGRLFDGYLEIARRCEVCGLELSAQDSGDGPAVFVILILGFIVVGLALWTEVEFEPPFWVHAILWPPVILGGGLLMLRPFKATLIALQYRHRRDTFDGRQ
ncbi:MAG: DUF983 domain-containing protein [Alphaproteobacteria bacterium]